jgi:hypothetical protein
MRSVVVKRNKHLGANLGGKLSGLTVGAVPPPNTLGIFLIVYWASEVLPP